MLENFKLQDMKRKEEREKTRLDKNCLEACFRNPTLKLIDSGFKADWTSQAIRLDKITLSEIPDWISCIDVDDYDNARSGERSSYLRELAAMQSKLPMMKHCLETSETAKTASIHTIDKYSDGHLGRPVVEEKKGENKENKENKSLSVYYTFAWKRFSKHVQKWITSGEPCIHSSAEAEMKSTIRASRRPDIDYEMKARRSKEYTVFRFTPLNDTTTTTKKYKFDYFLLNKRTEDPVWSRQGIQYDNAVVSVLPLWKSDPSLDNTVTRLWHKYYNNLVRKTMNLHEFAKRFDIPPSLIDLLETILTTSSPTELVGALQEVLKLGLAIDTEYGHLYTETSNRRWKS